jgi:CheY-like chemotaxis protein
LQEDNSNTRRVNGLGLGLSIVRNIIELHGGEVHVQSDGRGKGSTFMVTLSVTTPLREVSDLGDGYNSRENLENETKILSGLKILIVDDEPYARQLVKKILSKNGANVIDTSSASEALNGVRTENPDLIVSDIAMPEENGYEFIRKVRTLEPDMGHHIPSAALSAYVTKEDKERALSAGFEVHIGKPVEPHELVLKVAKLAGREVHN